MCSARFSQVVRKRGAWTFRKEWIFSVHRFFLKTVLSRSIPSHWSRSRMLDRCHDVCGGTTAGLWADLAGFGGGQRRPCPPPSCSAGTLEVGLLSPCTCGSICKRSPCTDSCRITRHGSLGKATRDEAALLRHASVRIAWAPRHRASCVLGIVCSIVYVKGLSPLSRVRHCTLHMLYMCTCCYSSLLLSRTRDKCDFLVIRRGNATEQSGKSPGHAHATAGQRIQASRTHRTRTPSRTRDTSGVGTGSCLG